MGDGVPIRSSSWPPRSSSARLPRFAAWLPARRAASIDPMQALRTNRRNAMHKLRAFILRLRGLFRSRRSVDDDFAAELDSHVALHTDDGIRAGLTPAEARRQASSASAARSKRARRIASAARSRGLKA
jgi:hypothetical protein